MSKHGFFLGGAAEGLVSGADTASRVVTRARGLGQRSRLLDIQERQEGRLGRRLEFDEEQAAGGIRTKARANVEAWVQGMATAKKEGVPEDRLLDIATRMAGDRSALGATVATAGMTPDQAVQLVRMRFSQTLGPAGAGKAAGTKAAASEAFTIEAGLETAGTKGQVQGRVARAKLKAVLGRDPTPDELVRAGGVAPPQPRTQTVTIAQRADNAEIDRARSILEEKGLSREEIQLRATPASAGGRINFDYDPFLAGIVRKATQHKAGDDPDFDAVFQRIHGVLTPEHARILDLARSAIAKGADPEQVRQRLIEQGIEPRSL